VTKRIYLLLPILAAACATAGGTGKRSATAERELPATSAVPGDAREALEAARASEAKGDATGDGEGAGEAARSEWAAAAAGYVAVAAQPAGSPWRVALLLRAAELRLRAQRWEESAETAGAVVSDASASAASKAVAARIVATSALAAASAAVKAGQIEKLDLREGSRRETQPPPQWRRVVDATDDYLARASADPREAGRQAGVSPAELALVAAEVQYAHGNLEDARRRLETVTTTWQSEAEVVERAVPLLLATFRARGDLAGHAAALERLHGSVARNAVEAPGEKEREAFGRAREGIERERAASRFGEAERLLARGKAEDAARLFEEVAAAPGVGEPANALHNAAVAWDLAGKPESAAVARERIVAEHAASPVAPGDALSLAAFRSRRAEHVAAARIYEEFLRSWPQSPRRCVALQNAASELDLAERRAEAAARYVAFGSDEGCAKSDPDLAARALVRAGRLFEAQAREAYSGAAALPGVAAPEARGLVAEAKRRLRGL